MYQLSNPRREVDHFGQSVLAFDYKLVREGKNGSEGVRISGKTNRGDLDVMGYGGLEKSGTARIRIRITHGLLGGGNDFELYLTIRAIDSAEYLVSNTVRLGNPVPPVQARELTSKEKESIARNELRRTPPASLPEGYLAVDQGTTLVPGMPVKAGWYGQWKDAEVISFTVGGPVVLKYEGEANLESHPREKWIAVDPEVAGRAKSDSGQFEVSVRTLPGSMAIIPDGAVRLNNDVELLPGTPLLLNEHGTTWRDVFVIDTQGTNVNLRYKNHSAAFDRTHPRDKLIITEAVLAKLTGGARETAKDEFAANLGSEVEPDHRHPRK